MRWQRAALFAAIVVAHVLVVLYFPAEPAPHDSPRQEISFATLLVPEPTPQPTSRPARQSRAEVSSLTRLAKAMRATRSAEAHHTNQGAAASTFQPDTGPKSGPSIDWAKEAQIAADNRMREDAETSRQAMALTLWQSRLTPSSDVPQAPTFRWDHARTHRLESSALGLNVNLNDRCSVLISIYLMAIIGGCKIGELPVHGDLFMHMKDDPDSSAPTGR